MTQFLWHTIQDPSGNWLGIMDEEKDDRWKSSVFFNYQLRHIDVTFAKYPYFVLWPPGTMFANSISPVLGQDLADGTPHQAAFEHWTVNPSGTYRPGYIVGQCVNAALTPLSGATVVLALTATDQFVSSGVTDANGNYMLPTSFAAQNHYIYANYGSGTFTGASVNTLVPNF